MLHSRRQFLSAPVSLATSAAVGAAVAPSLSDSSDASAVPIVDTHQHLWDLNRFILPWIDPDNPEQEPLRHTFLIPEYRQHTQGLNVVKTIYMEVNVRPDQQRQEADFVTELCACPDTGMVGAVIGGSPQDDGFADYITPLAERSAVCGVRTVLHDPDRPPGLCLQPAFVDNVRRLGDLDLNFDLCMRPAEIRDGVRLAEKCPGTRFVIDHCGNMGVRCQDQKLYQQWKDAVQAAADQDNMFMKISGIVATAKKGEWTPGDLASVVNFCLDAFGEDRCVFGGDWPVCLLTASLREWVGALKEIVRGRSVEFQRKLFHDNALRVYRLN